MGTPSNVYRGPVNTAYLGTDQLGYVGNAGVTITYEPVGYEFNDGQSYQLYGMAKWEIEIAEADSTTITTVSASMNVETAFTCSDLAGNTYTCEPALVNYTVTRGFGEEPHLLKITGQKKALSEDDFVTIS